MKDMVSRIESLEMLYSGQRIENLTATKIAFWNAGRDTINSQDIANADPLTVYIKGKNIILNAKILYVKNPANQFSHTLADDKSHITIDFDYIDKDEGAVIQILHTGKSDKDIEIRGTIKGAGKPILKSSLTMEKEILSIFPSLSSTSISRGRKEIGILCILSVMFIWLIVFLYSIFSETPTQTMNPSNRINDSATFLIVMIIASLPYLGLGFYFLLKRGMPKGFEEIEKDFEFERLS